MAKNGAKGRSPIWDSLPQYTNSPLWLPRGDTAGRYVAAKKQGGPFKGVKRET